MLDLLLDVLLDTIKILPYLSTIACFISPVWIPLINLTKQSFRYSTSGLSLTVASSWCKPIPESSVK